MKKDDYRELMILSLYGELSSDKKEELNRYLSTHPDLREEGKELQSLSSLIREKASLPVSDDTLQEARQQLRNALRSERQHRTLMQQIVESFGSLFGPRLNLAIVGAAALVLGIVIGRWIFPLSAGSPALPDTGAVIQSVVQNETPGTKTQIENVRFIDADASDGVIEFEFDAVAPMHLKGKVNDPDIQKVLTYALLNESNDGVRIRTMNAIAQLTEKKDAVDPAIKSALITTLKTDENPGVRSEALRVLNAYPYDNEIRDVLLYVLTHDANSGIRIAAVNALAMATNDGHRMGDSVAATLKLQLKNEQNNYIRNRAATLVKEIYQ